jgi:hypothetical protein
LPLLFFISLSHHHRWMIHARRIIFWDINLNCFLPFCFLTLSPLCSGCKLMASWN